MTGTEWHKINLIMKGELGEKEIPQIWDATEMSHPDNIAY